MPAPSTGGGTRPRRGPRACCGSSLRVCAEKTPCTLDAARRRAYGFPVANHYGPPDAWTAPRYSGIRTFARCPHNRDWEHADVAVLGVPFDTATSYRTGPRFGPAAIRDQSQLLRPWHPALAVDVFAALSVIDGGDLDVTPGNAERTAAQIADGLAPVVGRRRHPARARRRPLDRPRRAARARRAPRPARRRPARRPRRHLGQLLRRALLPRHAVPARARGGADRARAVAAGRHARAAVRGRPTSTSRAGGGSRSCPARSCATWTPEQYGARVRERLGDGPAFLSFDIDVLDPAFAPGTGTPEVGRAAAARGAGLPACARRGSSSWATTWWRCRRSSTGRVR